MPNEIPTKEAYYGFYQFSKQPYAAQLRPMLEANNIMDQVNFGIFVRNDGCIAEAQMSWHRLQSYKESPRLEMFDDAFLLFDDPVFKNLFQYLSDKQDFTPQQFCEMLLSFGFEDDSDNSNE